MKYLPALTGLEEMRNLLKPAYKNDTGKPRMDLIDPEWLLDVGRVLTWGSGSYDESQKVYENNWRQGGMRWGQVFAALQRHSLAFWGGEEIDPETGIPHMAHIACNSMFLHYYARNARHLDDRDLPWRRYPRIFLDIDGVLANWGQPMYFYLQQKHPTRDFQVNDDGVPIHWNWLDRDLWKEFRDGEYHEFMLNIPALVDSKDWNFEPIGYVTHRKVPTELTEKWIEQNGFPIVPVHTVDVSNSKVELLLELKADIFVDDKYETFVELNNAGILCYLMDRPSNQKYDVGAYRIFNLNEITDTTYSSNR